MGGGGGEGEVLSDQTGVRANLPLHVCREALRNITLRKTNFQLLLLDTLKQSLTSL